MMTIFPIFYNKCSCKNKKNAKKENGNVFKLKNKDPKMFTINQNDGFDVTGVDK